MSMNVDEILLEYEKEQFRNMYFSTSNKYKKLLNDYVSLIKKLVAVNAEKSLINSISNSYEQASSDYKKFLKVPDCDFQNRRLKVAQFNLQQAQKRSARYL